MPRGQDTSTYECLEIRRRVQVYECIEARRRVHTTGDEYIRVPRSQETSTYKGDEYKSSE